jgi:hypothetical protein
MNPIKSPQTSGHTVTKIISIVGYIISAVFFASYGPGLWLQCQRYCGNTADTCANTTGIGLLWALLTFSGIWMLFISLVLDIIALIRIKSSPYPLARRIGWLNGSSLIGIIICVISTLLLIISSASIGNCATFAPQAIILLLFIFIPPIASMWQNRNN